MNHLSYSWCGYEGAQSQDLCFSEAAGLETQTGPFSSQDQDFKVTSRFDFS